MIDSERTPETGPDNWLQIAKDAFTSSTTYLDANWRKGWERNIALFQSRHPDGSKYNSDAYKKRSRLFRPKTKSVVRKNEAAAAAAFFANVDVVSVEPENDSDEMQRDGATLLNELINYRLTKTIPWYITLIGAIQESQVIGVVGSYQYWHYKEKVGPVTYEPLLDDVGQPLTNAKGQPLGQEVPGEVEVTEDKPCIELMPVENYRFDPGANWTDVVGTSPYFIRLVPMYVDDVQLRMQEADSKTGAPKWTEYSVEEIRTAMTEYDSIRQQREGKLEDSKATDNAPLKAFEIVWCHENFVRLEGEELVYWTLGTQHLLSEPIPLKEAYFHGKRPFVIGVAVLEAHKAVPDSLVAIGAELQKEVNETVNSRRDNVSLVLNKRYVVKRNQQVDIDSLLKNVAGAVTMANSVDDVREIEFNDVTSSAYQEQDRLNVDYDELTGNFSQGSVQTNRKLNETVGGMQMMGGQANQMTEYLLRTFVETWVEPVLNQLALLEQYYETDSVILMLAGQRAELPPQAVQELVNALHEMKLAVTVNVGMGATDPHTKLQKFSFGMQTYSGVMQSVPDADPEAVRREVFGLAGYKDGSRFFKKGDDPAVAQLKGEIQKMGQAMQNMALELQSVKADKSAQTMKAQADIHRAGADAGLTAAQIDLAEAQTVKTLTEAAYIPSQAMAAKATNVG